MKALTAVAVLCALGTAAVAKPAPVERERAAMALSEADINIGASSAAREREYFEMPQAQYNSSGLACRRPLIVFDKTRVASSCH